MRRLQVQLDKRDYPILIGPGLLQQPQLLTSYIRGRQVMVVTNDCVAPLYLATLQQSLANFEQQVVILPDGEEFKDLERFNQIMTALLSARHNRTTTLIALGGGVIGDMTGFAAACYQRGVDFIQIPTTLLSQVDSSVGGKTAVNHPLGKNMIGAFYQPRLVIADTLTLNTLPARELSAGLAEVIKYGIILDAEFFDWLERNMPLLMASDQLLLGEAIERCCRIKAEVVAQDEKEEGLRALLNLGHTFGHAIEVACGYGQILHGEAVAIGICLAAETAKVLGSLSIAEQQRIEALLRAAALPTRVPVNMTHDDFLIHMARDKKVLDGRLRLVLPVGIGQAEIRNDVSQQILLNVIDACR